MRRFSLFDGRTLLSVFNADLSGIDVRLEKPDTGLFLLAAKSLDIPPVQCLVVEDAPARAPRGGQNPGRQSSASA